MTDVVGTVISALVLVVTIIGGLLKVLWGRLDRVDSDQTILAGEMRQAMQAQASNHRVEQTNLWQELRRIADKNNEQHTHAAEVMGKLPNRDEMTASLAAMEARIMTSLRKEVGNR